MYLKCGYSSLTFKTTPGVLINGTTKVHVVCNTEEKVPLNIMKTELFECLDIHLDLARWIR